MGNYITNKKRISPFVVAVPVFILLAVFKLWPAVLSVLMSFRDYSVKLGIVESKYVGLENYISFFSQYCFSNIVRNTFLMTLLPAVFTALLSLGISFVICKLPNKWLKYVSLVIIAVPAILPTHALAQFVKNFLDADSVLFQIGLHKIMPVQNLLSIPRLFVYFYSAAEAIKNMIFPVAYGVLVYGMNEKVRLKQLLKVALGYILVRFGLMLIYDYELVVKLYSPLVLETADTLSTFSYRKALMTSELGLATAVDNMRVLMQVIINIPIYFILKRLFRKDEPLIGSVIQAGTGSTVSKIAIALMLICGAVVLMLGGIYAAGAALLFAAVSLLLAYPLTSKTKAYPLVLYMLLTLNFITAERLNYLRLGLEDSLFTGALILGISVYGALALLAVTRGRKNILAVLLAVIMGCTVAVNTIYGRNELCPYYVNVLDMSKILVGKPVIYLYPLEKTEVNVNLDFIGELTFTYPEYGGGWNVVAYPDGTIVDENGNTYSYLFWEGLSDIQFDLSKGFVVSGEDTVDFLREKLAFIGLEPAEYNEFIVYWAPQLMENEYNLITFQNKCYTDNAKLTIDPEPESVLRVYMVAKPLNYWIEIQEQELLPFERKGFTVVEWGGSIIKKDTLH